MGLPITLTWPLVAVLGMLIGALTYLAQDHDISTTTTGTLLGAIVSGVLVGHFSSSGGSGGGQ
jgi:hypothetical protein